jgi:hypothetical protein
MGDLLMLPSVPRKFPQEGSSLWLFSAHHRARQGSSLRINTWYLPIYLPVQKKGRQEFFLTATGRRMKPGGGGKDLEV